MTTQEQWPLEAFAQAIEESIDLFQWSEPARLADQCVLIEVRTGGEE